jgi:hypothetical protein
MRTIFITPLLWKRLNRSAIRRGEEGQAIVLIAFVAIGMVAMVGLAIDGGLGYLESTRMQRAADAAALAGVIWLPDNRPVADARAQLAAEANGIQVACYYNSAQADNSAYNQRCRRASFTTVTQNGPDKFYSFDSEAPQGLAIQYKVTLSKMQTRFFLGVLGFPSYPIVRTSTAEYYHRVKFGSSFNYYGSNGVLADHYMRCDTASLTDCDGVNNTELNMRGATYQKYILMRCDQPSPPKPCVGNFWANIAGQDVFHGNGDAYNPIRDGAKTTSASTANVTKFIVNGEVNTETGSLSKGCLHHSDTNTWFINEIFTATSLTCPPVNSAGLPIQNLDTHPDSPLGRKGFGSEVIIDVDQAAIYSYSETISNTENHTNLNVTIYDGAMNEHGIYTNFNVGDNYNTSAGNNYAALPPYTKGSSTVTGGYADWDFQFITNTNGANDTQGLNNANSWSTKRLICSPGTTAISGTTSPSGSVYNTSYCDTGATATTPARPTYPRATDWDPSVKWNATTNYDPNLPWSVSNPVDRSNFFPDRNNLELTYNDIRMRYTLYGPPPTPAIPSIYGNVQPYWLGSMEMTDMSVQSRDVQYPIGCPQVTCTPVNYQRFCYFIFDDTKSFWDNTKLINDATTTGAADARVKTPPGTGTANVGPDYAYSTFPTSTTTTGTPRAISNRYAYVCPESSTSDKNTDMRWNQLKGTPTARYGGMTATKNDRTIQAEILDTTGVAGTSPISPVVTGTLSNGTSVNLGNPVTQSTATTKVNIWDVSGIGGTTFQQVVDPQQDCRKSAVDMSATSATAAGVGYPIDPLWGHNRIPFNLAYGDPVVNRAWITTPTVTTTTQYYTLYYSFHGWRCDWDFDSNYTYDPKTGRGNPLLNPALPPSTTNPSLSLKERLVWGNTAGKFGKYDKAFVQAHPGLTSITYTTDLLLADGASCVNAYRDFPRYTNYTGRGGCTALTGIFNGFDNGESSSASKGFGLDKDFGLQPYFHMTNIAWNPNGDGTIVPAPGFNEATAPVRAGSYLLHIQTFSGSAANQYSVKAEYENPKQVVYTTAAGTLTVTPVPSVYPLSAMSIFSNNGNTELTQDVVFDLAFIPPEYAGTQGTVQLWDPGDVSGSLSVSILKPSTFGPKVNTSGGVTPDLWSVPLGAPITTTISACPFALNPAAFGASYNCVFNSSQTPATSQTFTNNNNRYYNDQWVFLSFKIPSLTEYNTWKASCEVNGVPENLCYYFQIDYKLVNSLPTDVTTWQLLVQGQPVHLVDNEGNPT